MVWYHLLKIKAPVDHAGHSQLLALCNHIGIFLEKEEISLSHNNSLLTVLEILITMAAMVDYHLTRLSISGILADFKLTPLIHMLQKPILVYIDHKFLLLIVDMEVSILLKVTKSNLQRDSIMLALFQSPSKSLLDSKIMQEEFTV